MFEHGKINKGQLDVNERLSANILTKKSSMNQNAAVFTNSMERIQNISAQIKSAEEAMINEVDVDRL